MSDPSKKVETALADLLERLARQLRAGELSVSETQLNFPAHGGGLGISFRVHPLTVATQAATDMLAVAEALQFTPMRHGFTGSR